MSLEVGLHLPAIYATLDVEKGVYGPPAVDAFDFVIFCLWGLR